MAVTASSRVMTYTDVMADIRNSKFAPVYLLQGEEAYYIDAIAGALAERVVPDEGDRDFDMTNLFGAETSINSVADAARRFPVMAERQLVMLREVQAMTNGRAEIEKLASYAAKPSERTVLVITFKAEPLKATSALVKAIKKGGGVVFTSEKVKDYKLFSHIMDYCKDRKVKISRAAAELLGEYIGTDLARAFSEVDKLTVAAPGAPITPELIEKNIGISKDYNNFELIKAIANKNYPAAMRIVSYFESRPRTNPVVMTVSLLFRYFSQLMMAHYAPEKTPAGIMRQLDFHSSWQMKDIEPGMRNYKAGSVMRILHALRLLDCRSKGIGSMQNEYALLRTFIYEVFTL